VQRTFFPVFAGADVFLRLGSAIAPHYYVTVPQQFSAFALETSVHKA